MHRFSFFLFITLFIISGCGNKLICPNEIRTNVRNDLPGYKIAFASPHNNFNDHNSDIWIMNPDGTGLVNLTPGTQGEDLYPEWGPNGKYIYYTSTQNGGSFELYRVNTIGPTSPTQITDFGREVRSLSISPDNKLIALSLMTGSSEKNGDLSGFSSDLYLLEMKDVNKAIAQKKLIKKEDLQLLVSSPKSRHIWYEQPHWSPIISRNPWLAYSKTKGYDTPREQESIWKIRADGTGKTLVSDNDSMPRWTSDGQSIVTFGFNKIIIATGEKKEIKIDKILPSAGSPSFSPDGKYILFETGDSNRKAGLAYTAYSDEDKKNPYITPSSRLSYEPRWSPVPLPQPPYHKNGFTKKIQVFGIPLKATSLVPDEKLIHAAAVMAQYLDSNEDGKPDNQRLINILIKKQAVLLMFANEEEMETLFKKESDYPKNGQPLYAYETHPRGSEYGIFDGSIEEILHLITHAGYSNLKPNIFGVSPGSSIADAMDSARGGHFQKIPKKYPDNAWYTYNDDTCDYSCQITEYTYWALTSILGGQSYPGRYDEIKEEWKLNTREKLRATDKKAYKILTSPENGMPSKLPDGNYKGKTFSIERIH